MPPLPDFPAPAPLRTDRAEAASLLRVTGADRLAFLTRIMGGALPSAPGAARTALLGPKGNLIAAGVATVLGDAVLIETERVRGEALRAALDRYRISDAVEIRPLDLAPGALVRLEGAPPPEGLDRSVPGSVLETASGFLRRDFRPWPAFTVFDPDTTAPPGGTAVEADAAAQDYLRVLAGEPHWGAELDETSLPLACGLAAHVRLGKGCYIGQEYVARQAHRGRIPRLLRGLDLTGAGLPEPGAGIRFEGRPAGRLTSAAPRPARWPQAATPIALAVLRAELEPGARVEVAGQPVRTARLVALPAIP